MLDTARDEVDVFQEMTTARAIELAEQLGVSRSALYRRLQQFGL